MNIKIQNELDEYMHQHDRHTISLRLVHDDYSGANIYSEHPRIRWAKPKHTENFDQYQIDDITVYVEKGIKAKDQTLELVHEELLGIHRCHVKGLDLDYVKTFMQ